jgi:L-fucose mutarotase/ribose pyranase (RbsD/FucU family)
MPEILHPPTPIPIPQPPRLFIPVINSLSPTTAGPGDTVVISGANFGATQGSGYVLFSDNGVNWGQPGDLAVFQLLSWSDTQISFLVPVKDSNGYQTTPGTTATVTVTNGAGLHSSAQNLAIQPAVSAIPVISSVSPTSAGPGDTIVINGQNFGAQQGTGYVLFSDNRVNWGQPGDVAAFQIVHWSDAQISLTLPSECVSLNRPGLGEV